RGQWKDAGPRDVHRCWQQRTAHEVVGWQWHGSGVWLRGVGCWQSCWSSGCHSREAGSREVMRATSGDNITATFVARLLLVFTQSNAVYFISISSRERNNTII
uniref:Uncharacterized protein n=1 Tax=Aegilops tauschii subsp. strangulata TaxID=200361 RepID=A0A452YPR8_AEGTS